MTHVYKLHVACTMGFPAGQGPEAPASILVDVTR